MFFKRRLDPEKVFPAPIIEQWKAGMPLPVLYDGPAGDGSDSERADAHVWYLTRRMVRREVALGRVLTLKESVEPLPPELREIETMEDAKKVLKRLTFD